MPRIHEHILFCLSCGSPISIDVMDDFPNFGNRLFKLNCECRECETPWAGNLARAFQRLAHKEPRLDNEQNREEFRMYACELGFYGVDFGSTDDEELMCPICRAPSHLNTRLACGKEVFQLRCMGCGWNVGRFAVSVDEAETLWREECSEIEELGGHMARMTKDKLKELANNGYWQDSKGNMKPIACMSERHILNCIAMLNEHQPPAYEVMVEKFESELDSRGRSKPVSDEERMGMMADICRDLFKHAKPTMAPMMAKRYERLLTEAGVDFD